MEDFMSTLSIVERYLNDFIKLCYVLNFWLLSYGAITPKDYEGSNNFTRS